MTPEEEHVKKQIDSLYVKARTYYAPVWDRIEDDVTQLLMDLWNHTTWTDNNQADFWAACDIVYQTKKVTNDIP